MAGNQLRPIREGGLDLHQSYMFGDAFHHVFPGKHGGPCNAKNEWVKIRKVAGFEDVRLHDLRHSFASILVSSGATLEIIGAMLGHSQPSTTKRYSHLYDEPLLEAAETVAAAVATAGKPKGELVTLKRGA